MILTDAGPELKGTHLALMQLPNDQPARELVSLQQEIKTFRTQGASADHA